MWLSIIIYLMKELKKIIVQTLQFSIEILLKYKKYVDKVPAKNKPIG